MRVLLVCGSYPPVKCGVGDYTAILAAELATGHDVTVGVLTGTASVGTIAPAGVQLLPLLEGWGVGQVATMRRLVRSWRPDVVHLQYPARGYGRGKGALFLPLLLAREGLPVVQTWHEPLGFMRRLRYLPAALARDALIVVEPDYDRFVSGWFKNILHRKKAYRYIPVGSNIPFRGLTDAERLRIKGKFAPAGCNLVAYFGFVAPPKGVEMLFAAADPERDRLLLMCDLDREDPYHRSILALAEGDRWRGKAFVTGYLEAGEVAALLAAADAAVFPFLQGVTSRNASVLAARRQGTFVLTTHGEKHGYIDRDNIYYARPGDSDEMREALCRYSGVRGETGEAADWVSIAAAHLRLYRELVADR